MWDVVKEVLVAALAIGGLGAVAAFALGVAAKVFYVKIDPLILEIEEALPGANCGGCGQPGCSGAAVAIASGKMPANACVAGGAEVGAAIAAILGVEIRETEPSLAKVGCRYPTERADIDYVYAGVTDCRAAVLLADGPKECPVGCIGLGSCVKSCPFDALEIGPDNLPVVNEVKCTGCGTCVRTCPMDIMKLTSVSLRIVGEYDRSDCTAPCQRRCPAGIDIPEQIHQTALGNYEQALLTIKERNPLPLICGRICPNPCELLCRRNLTDEPVAINHLKRFVADYERKSGRRFQCFKAPDTGIKVAVIGGGVEGLTAANYLARLGHSPAIFEARPDLGGLLRTAIPESRLPRDVLDWEIEGILELGVEAKTSTALGRDVNLSQLFDQGFEAILLTTGGWDALLSPGRDLNPAPALPGIYLLLPLTMAWAAGQEAEIGSKIVVVGGGKGALNAAQRCRQKGADQVTILWSGTEGRRAISKEEIEKAAAEGITILPGARATRLTGIGDRLTGMVIEETGLTERTIDVDTIIVAGGRTPEMIVSKIAREEETPEQKEIPGTEIQWETAIPYAASPGPKDLFYSRGAVSDYRAAIEAIGAGRRAAASVHAVLFNDELPELKGDIINDTPLVDVNHLEKLVPVVPRAPMPEASPVQRVDPRTEVALGLTEEAAREEASRCLNCGLICYYRTQYH